jgi:hypothetical protein
MKDVSATKAFSKVNIQHFKTYNFLTFLFLWAIFLLLDPDPNRIRNTASTIPCASYRQLVPTFFSAGLLAGAACAAGFHSFPVSSYTMGNMYWYPAPTKFREY